MIFRYKQSEIDREQAIRAICFLENFSEEAAIQVLGYLGEAASDKSAIP